jgi:hypothetical protein
LQVEPGWRNWQTQRTQNRLFLFAKIPLALWFLELELFGMTLARCGLVESFFGWTARVQPLCYEIPGLASGTAAPRAENQAEASLASHGGSIKSDATTALMFTHIPPFQALFSTFVTT